MGTGGNKQAGGGNRPPFSAPPWRGYTRGMPKSTPANPPPRAAELQPSMGDIVRDAFQGAGGRAAFRRWARDNPETFYTKVLPKIIPTQVGGLDGQPIAINVNVPAPLGERVPGVLNSPIPGAGPRLTEDD